MNVLPCPASTSTRRSPPSRPAISRRDREAEAGAAVLAARRAVGLLERLEDQPLLVLRDADAGIGDRERDDVGRRADDTRRLTRPRSVNFIAFDSRLRST